MRFKVWNEKCKLTLSNIFTRGLIQNEVSQQFDISGEARLFAELSYIQCGSWRSYRLKLLLTYLLPMAGDVTSAWGSIANTKKSCQRKGTKNQQTVRRKFS